MSRFNSDIVELNVGGTSFTSSISTLASSSSYFSRRFSDEWRDENSSEREHVVIDQDPGLFSVLLSFMRLGWIEAEKLTTPVILLAIFFGMDQLLDAIRAEAIRCKFEGRNLALFRAAQAARLVDESDVRKQFASLTICHPDFISFVENRGVNPDFIVFVEIENDDGTVEMPTNCFTFVDALNFLSKSGYTKYETEKFESNKDFTGSIARMWFSKLVSENQMEGVDGYSPMGVSASESIRIIEKDGYLPMKHPREFCYIIDNDLNGDELSHMDLSILEADIGGDEKQIQFDGHLVLLDETRVGTSRSVILDNIDSKIKKYNWLQAQGYTTRENELSSAYSEGIKIHNPRGGHHYIVSVWSRPAAEPS